MSDLTALDWQFINGYRDGRCWYKTLPKDASAAYKHSFRIGRAEIEGRATPGYSVSSRRAQMIEDSERINN